MRGRVLIAEGLNDRAALAACRALYSAGWEVGVASYPGAGLAAASRSVSARHRSVPPERDLDRFVEHINAAIRQGAYEVVFPGYSDSELMALSLRREEIDAAVPFAPHETVVRSLDKLELTWAAATAGLAAPETVEANDSELERRQPPYVIKQRTHARFDSGRGTSRIATRIIEDRDEGRRMVERIRRQGGTPLLQEAIEGNLIAFVAFMSRDGRLRARAQQKAERIWPPRSGFSSRSRTVAVEDDLSARVEALLQDFGWFGIAELQFLARPGRPPTLIDLNGRFYGSLALAVSADLNLPAMWAAEATGRTAAGGVARPGVRYQWLEGDLRRALVERRCGLVHDLLETLRVAAKDTVHSIWDRRDPFPFVRAVGLLVRRGWRRLTGRSV